MIGHLLLGRLLLGGFLGVAMAQGTPGPEGASGGPPPPPGGGGKPEEGLAVAVVVPSGASTVRLVVDFAERPGPVAMTDDGSLDLDLPRDGEWWAFLVPPPGQSTVIVNGNIDGREVWHTEAVRVPKAWNTYPVTFVAIEGDDGWRLQRTLFADLPHFEDAPTGAGIGFQAEQVGFSAPVLALLWGGLVMSVVAIGSLRGAILRVR